MEPGGQMSLKHIYVVLFWGRWIFLGRKNPEHKSSGRVLKPLVPSLRFQGSLKYLNSEKELASEQNLMCIFTS